MTVVFGWWTIPLVLTMLLWGSLYRDKLTKQSLHAEDPWACAFFTVLVWFIWSLFQLYGVNPWST